MDLPLNPKEESTRMMRQPVVELMDPMMVEIMRNKTPAERLAVAFRMWDSARLIVKGGVMYLHPDWTDKEVELEIALRMRGSLTP
jgi:Rv0078B-related antitoxin